MATTVTRKYKTKDVEMLTAAATIIENAIANKTFLQSKRTTWADPFFGNLKKQIQSTTDTYLGKDSSQKNATSNQLRKVSRLCGGVRQSETDLEIIESK